MAGKISHAFRPDIRVRLIDARPFFGPGTSALLRAIQERYGTLDCIAGLVRALILVNCGEGFQDIGAVADGFSDLCVEVLQERGRHVRTVMGTRNMPNHNIPVEVELIFRLAEGYGEEA